MIKLKTLLTLALCALFISSAQSQQMFMIHQDQVNPDKLMLYEETTATLNKYIKEHGIDMYYSTAMTNDLNYSYIIPIDSYADIDGMDAKWAALTEKAGEEKMNEVWSNFGQCYDVHKDYVVVLDEDLSYYPSGEIMSDQGGMYRKWTFLYGHPDKMEQLYEMAKKWKELYKKHDIESGYRVYRPGVGVDQSLLLIVDYGESVAHIAQKEQNLQAKIGMEGQALWMESIKYVRDYEEKYGQMRPDISNMPGAGSGDED